MRLGILGCSDIARRRFMPAAKDIAGLEVVAVSEEYDKRKLSSFTDEFPIETVENFNLLICRKDIDAIYIPQPPALHFKWAKASLKEGKHVLIEKPSTVSFEQSKELVDIARVKGLALHENYMFQYHSQIQSVKEIIQQGVIGEVRLYQACFGFPKRSSNDFRYNKEMGGGALLDAGGYTIKLATLMLGENVKVDTACLNKPDGYEVDIYGAATLRDDKDTICQISFGMDCSYRCSLEVWGSQGRLFTNRIFTAPEDYQPVLIIERGNSVKELRLNADSHFQRSIEKFINEVKDEVARNNMYEQILQQAKLVEDVRDVSERR